VPRFSTVVPSLLARVVPAERPLKFQRPVTGDWEDMWSLNSCVLSDCSMSTCAPNHRQGGIQKQMQGATRF
jgi:hypothetical protein